MKRKDFLLHLVGELSHYMLETEPERLLLSLHMEEDGVHLTVMDTEHREATELDAIRASLNKTQRPELAGYYGNLAGYDSLGDARLNLVGWQVKRAEVHSTEEGTKIDIWLGGDQFDPGRFTIHDT